MRSRSALATLLLAAAVFTAACSREPEGLEIATGSDVTLEKNDGVTVSGRLVEVRPQEVVLEAKDGQRTRVPGPDQGGPHVGDRSAGTSSAAPAQPATPAIARSHPGDTRGRPPPELPAPSAAATRRRPPAPEYREVTIPAGTVLPIELRTTVGSETSKVEDQVRAHAAARRYGRRRRGGARGQRVMRARHRGRRGPPA